MEGEPVRPDPPAVWDINSILCTSGTEGPSKGVLSTHGHAFQVATYSAATGPDDVVLIVMPLFHSAGLWAGLFNTMRCGAAAVIRTRFSATEFWKVVSDYRCTQTFLVGAMADFLMREAPSPDDAANPLRTVTIIPAIPGLDAFTARFGVAVDSSYGQTETGGLTVTDPGTVPPGVCGRPRSFIDMRLVDDRDVEVAPGEVGEIVVRSREPWSMMAGYHRMPQETVHAWRNLWLHTGDAAYQDEAGRFVFVDRKKDALRRRGENISSKEVEEQILVRADVAEVAIVAVPSQHSEDEIKAVVVLNPGHDFEPVDMVRDLAERLPYFMVPRYYEVRDSMPLTPTLKVKKSELRREGITEATWDCQAAGLFVTRDGLQIGQPTP